MSKRRRNSYSEYERRGSLQRRSIHHHHHHESKEEEDGPATPVGLTVQSTLPSRKLEDAPTEKLERHTTVSSHTKRRRFSMNSEKTRRLSASGMIAKGARKSLAAFKRLFSVHRGSNYSEKYGLSLSLPLLYSLIISSHTHKHTHTHLFIQLHG